MDKLTIKGDIEGIGIFESTGEWVSEDEIEVTVKMGKDSYTALFNAVIVKAAEDYRDALRRLKKCPNSENAKKLKDDCEEFFGSVVFKACSPVNGEWLKSKLATEVDF